MKKILFLLIAVFCILVSTCNTNKDMSIYTDLVSRAREVKIKNPSDSYNPDMALSPIFTGNYVYEETVAFVGKNDHPSLIFTPSQIESVWDYERSTQYIEHVDFEVHENRLYLTENSRIRYWDVKDYHSDNPETENFCVCRTAEGMPVFIHESIPSDFLINVSYRHSQTDRNLLPEYHKEVMSPFLNKLKNGENVNLLYWGDSITRGYGSSEIAIQGGEGFSYPKLINHYLNKKYPDQIHSENISKTGDAALAGVSLFDNIKNTPDLAIIAFGMNDFVTPQEDYALSISNMMNLLKEKNPEVCIILVSPMCPNYEIKELKAGKYSFSMPGAIVNLEAPLQNLALMNQNTICIPMTKISTMLNTIKSKRFVDLGSNNLNHPNDFMHRIYAQSILYGLLGDDFTAINQ